MPRPLGHSVCATCKGTKKVPLRNGTEVDCLPCSIPRPGQTIDAPGTDPNGPGDTEEELTE